MTTTQPGVTKRFRYRNGAARIHKKPNIQHTPMYPFSIIQTGLRCIKVRMASSCTRVCRHCIPQWPHMYHSWIYTSCWNQTAEWLLVSYYQVVLIITDIVSATFVVISTKVIDSELKHYVL